MGRQRPNKRELGLCGHPNCKYMRICRLVYLRAALKKFKPRHELLTDVYIIGGKFTPHKFAKRTK
jgi:hypothetical protein